jgi:hypothetical protein
MGSKMFLLAEGDDRVFRSCLSIRLFAIELDGVVVVVVVVVKVSLRSEF